MMINHAKRYIRSIGKARILIFSTNSVSNKSIAIVKTRDVAPTCRSLLAFRQIEALRSTTLVARKNDVKLQNGTVSIANAGGSLCIIPV